MHSNIRSASFFSEGTVDATASDLYHAAVQQQQQQHGPGGQPQLQQQQQQQLLQAEFNGARIASDVQFSQYHYKGNGPQGGGPAGGNNPIVSSPESGIGDPHASEFIT